MGDTEDPAQPASIARKPDEPRPATNKTIYSLSPEIFAKVISEIAGPDLVLHADDERILREQRVTPLRLVSRRFKDTVDYLFANNPPKHISFCGGIPTDDAAKMSAIYWACRAMVKSRMCRLNRARTKSEFKISVHLLPDPASARAALEWQLGSRGRLSKNLQIFGNKCDLTAEMAMRSHHAAALMLSRVLHNAVLAQPYDAPRISFKLVFHEIDGSHFDAATMPLSERQKKPKCIPFWDLEATRTIVTEWQWIRRSNPQGGLTLGSYVILPNIAYATDMPGTWTEQEIYGKCARGLNAAWTSREPVDHPPTRPPFNRYVRVRIPGFVRPVPIPRDRIFAWWLTTLSQRTLSATCYAVRGLETSPGGDKDDEKAVLLDRPDCLNVILYED